MVDSEFHKARICKSAKHADNGIRGILISWSRWTLWLKQLWDYLYASLTMYEAGILRLQTIIGFEIRGLKVHGTLCSLWSRPQEVRFVDTLATLAQATLPRCRANTLGFWLAISSIRKLAWTYQGKGQQKPDPLWHGPEFRKHSKAYICQVRSSSKWIPRICRPNKRNHQCFMCHYGSSARIHQMTYSWNA